MDVDTRLLPAFVAIAEERNLTRAAQRLSMSQPALSKQLRRLESDLKVKLFARGRHGAQLTFAGEALLGSARSIVASWETGQRRVRVAARLTRPELAVGFIANAAAEHTTQIAARFGELRPDVQLDMQQIDWGDPSGGLSSGLSDAALVRLPLPDPSGLIVHRLFSEPMCLAVPADHRLAGRSGVSITDVLEESFVATRGPVAWRDWWLAAEHRDGRPAIVNALVGTPDEWLTAILTGRGVSFAFASAARYYAPPGIAYVDVAGLPPSVVAVAHRQDTPNPAVDAFVAACRQAVRAHGTH